MITTPQKHQKVRTNVYLDAAMKDKAQEIFKMYGMGLSDAFNMFLSQSVLEKGIPFEIKIPNDETLQAMQEVENGDTETLSYEDHIQEMKQCIKHKIDKIEGQTLTID